MLAITRTGNFLEGTLVPFAGPADDGYGTWWDSNTNFAIDMYAPHPLFYLHGVRDLQQHGRLRDFGIEDDGLHVRAQLTRQNSPIYALVDSGSAAWSSGSMAGIASPPRPDGYIERWPIVEGSIAHRNVVVARAGLTKADYVRAGLDVRDGGHHLRSIWTGVQLMDGVQPDGIKEQELPADDDQKNQNSNATTSATPADGNESQTEETLPSQDADEMTQFRAWQADRAKKKRKDELRSMLAEFGITLPGQDATRSLPKGGQDTLPVQPRDTVIRVASPWDQVSLLGMTAHYEGKLAVDRRGSNVMDQFDDKYYRALLHKIEKQWAKDKDVEQEWIATPEGFLPVVPMRAIDEETFKRWTKYVPNLRANEAMGSTLTGFGDELVPTLSGSALYYFMRLESRVAPLFRTFMTPSEPFDYPKMTSGPTFVRATEITDAANFAVSNLNYDTSRPGTGKVRFTAGKLAAATLYTEEQIEDSNIAFSEAMARLYVTEMAHAFDFVLLNGDTSANTTNISFYGTNPNNNTATKRILTFNGIRKGIAAADQTAVANITDESILPVMATMGSRGIIGRDIRNLVCIAPPEVGYKLDALSAYEGFDKVGAQATLLTGQLGFWRSVPVVVTEEYPETDQNGRVDDTAATNNKGAWIVAHRNSIMIGMRRMPRIEQQKVPGVDGSWITASLRADVNLLEPGAAAMGYNSAV